MIRDCIIVASACMFVLASTSNSYLEDVGMPIEARASEELKAEVCSRCGETIGPDNLSELVLCLGLNPSHRKHAFHRKCMAEWVVQERAGKSQEAYPLCVCNSGLMYARSRRKVLKEFILQSMEEEKELEELRRRALRGTLEKSGQVDLEAADHFKILGKVYDQLPYVYDYFPHDPTSPRNSKIDGIFGSIGEKMLGEMPVEEATRALAYAPKFVHTEGVLNYIRDPIFYIQLSSEQLLELGKCLLLLARSSEEEFVKLFIPGYIRFSFKALDGAGIGSLLDLTEDLGLRLIQRDMLQELRAHNADFSPECRRKLAVLALANPLETITNKLCILRSLGYFSCEEEEREEAIQYWKKTNLIDANAEDKLSNGENDLILKILSFRPEGSGNEDLEAEALRPLLQIHKELSGKSPKGTKRGLRMLKLEYYSCMLCLSSPSRKFLADTYKLLTDIKKQGQQRALNDDLAPFVPSAASEQRALILAFKGLVRSRNPSPRLARLPSFRDHFSKRDRLTV